MSNFQDWTVNPITLEKEYAEWIDDYFGRHEYGVFFPKTGTVHDVDEIKEGYVKHRNLNNE